MKREYPEAPVSAVGVVVLHGNKVLLIKRGREPLRNRWSLPGGAVELGETVRQTAEREIREECGVQVIATEVIEVLDSVTLDDEGRVRFHYVLTELLADYVSGTLAASSDALEARWVALDEVDDLDLLPITLKVIREGADRRRRIQIGEIPTEARVWQREFWS